MAYSLIEQETLDINWYFIDRFKHICVAISAGGFLPQIINENEEKNDQFHKIINLLPERFESIRNKAMIKRIQGIESDEEIETYFSNFEILARKGLFVFDRHQINDSNDPNYFLVAYPKYDTKIDEFPLKKDDLLLIPRIKQTISKRIINPFNLTAYFYEQI